MRKNIKWWDTKLAAIGATLMLTAIVGTLSNSKEIVVVAMWGMLFCIGFLLIVIAIVISFIPHDTAKIISQLDILKEQFADAAKTSPTINHILLQQSKNGIDPIVPDMLTHSCRLWDEKIGRWPRHGDERGYPIKHWLFFIGSLSQSELSEKQIMAANYEMLGRFCKLASETGEIVNVIDSNILPISKSELWLRDPEEYWLLLLHHFCPSQHDFWFVPEGKIPAHGEMKGRPAKEGEPYSAVLENVFLLSAFACGTLLERIKQ